MTDDHDGWLPIAPRPETAPRARRSRVITDDADVSLTEPERAALMNAVLALVEKSDDTR